MNHPTQASGPEALVEGKRPVLCPLPEWEGHPSYAEMQQRYQEFLAGLETEAATEGI